MRSIVENFMGILSQNIMGMLYVFLLTSTVIFIGFIAVVRTGKTNLIEIGINIIIGLIFVALTLAFFAMTIYIYYQ